MGARKTVMMDCDNPECASSLEHSKDEPANGFYLGKGSYIHDWGGGPLRAIYVCSIECIEPALKAVYQEEMGRR